MNEEEFQYVIEQLDKHHKADFSCGIEQLDRYIKAQAGQDIKKHISVTYVLTEKSCSSVLGYYSISTIGIFPGELPDDLIKKLPKYPMLPGVLLARLAVDVKYKGKGFGGLLLLDALRRCLALSKQIGISAVIVEAKNEVASEFYKHFGFIAFLDNKSKLFMPLACLKKLNL